MAEDLDKQGLLSITIQLEPTIELARAAAT